MNRSARFTRLPGLAGRRSQVMYVLLLTVLGTSISSAQAPARDAAQPEPRSFVQLTGGDRFMCGLTAQGDASCWGKDDYGQVGAGDVVSICPRHYREGRFGRFGTQACATAPQRVAGRLSFTTIDAGALHTCGLTAAGEAYCWGHNAGGALGTTDSIQCGPVNDSVLPVAERTTNCSRTPVRVSTDRRFTSISVGGASACALTPEGEAYCWGGMSGPRDPPPPLDPSVPRPVSGNVRFTSITVRHSQACGLDRAGKLYCWGGQLPDEPAHIPMPAAFTAVSLGWDHTCGLTAAGVAYCWGDNTDGQVGTGRAPEPHERVDTATEVAGGLRFQEIQAGMNRTCGITVDRALYCWGDRAGSFGPDRCYHVDAYNDCTAGPRRVLAEPVRTVGLGWDHNCAVTAAGSAYCWGTRWGGSFGDGGWQSLEHDPLGVHWRIPPPIVQAHYVIRCTADKVAVIPQQGADTVNAPRDTTLSYATTTPGFVTPERVTIRGAEYVRFGVMRHVHGVDLHWFAEHEGVPFFRWADDDAGAPEVLYLPHAPTCVMRPYSAR